MSNDNQKWESLTKESILVKKPWFEVFREEVRLPDGKIVPEYFGIEMPHYTAVFAVTEERRIIILRCYRHAIGEVTLTMGAFIGNSTRGCGTYHLFFATGAYSVQEPDSGDLEELELLLWTPEEVELAIDDGRAQSLGLLSMLLLGLRCL